MYVGDLVPPPDDPNVIGEKEAGLVAIAKRSLDWPVENVREGVDVIENDIELSLVDSAADASDTSEGDMKKG